MKNIPTNEGDWGENPKNHDEKTFEPELKAEKENRDWWREEGFVWEETCSRRDLDDEGLGQNKVIYSFSEVKLPIVNYHADFPVLLVLRR